MRTEWERQQAQLLEGSERLRKERESLKKDKQALDHQQLEMQSAYTFNELFIDKFKGDPLVYPDTAETVSDVLDCIEDTRNSLELLANRYPQLLEQLPDHLQEHCFQALKQPEQEREEPELEQKLGGLFD